ncbi:MAG: ABC transporter ATP-binding protein [Dehalococcoidia bacterium]
MESTSVLEPAPPAASPNPVLAVTPLRDQKIAVDVQNATKVFVTPPSLLSRLRGNRTPRKRVVAVDNISLQVRRGEIFGILGPNGTGKSTLIRLMSTLLIPDSGSVTVFGYDIEKDEATVKRLINRVSVEASFFKKLSPMENLLYGARLYSVDAAEARVSIRRILKRLGIEDESVMSPMEDMSRGMQQKVAIARAFLSAPIVLLLDEPTTGLDPHSKKEVQAFVREIRDVHDATVLLTTHDMQEADDLCDRIAIVDQGGIVALDTGAALKERVKGEKYPNPTLEDVFLELTGKSFVDSDVEEKP